MGKGNLVVGTAERSVESLQRLQKLPLEQKVNLSLRRIKQFYDQLNGNVYISFSGGKDSTVLLHLVRSLYPEAKAMFVNTGLEFSSIVSFVKTIENVDIIKPEMRFDEVLDKYGYPVISKEVSRGIRDLQTVNESNIKTAKIRIEGSIHKGKLSKMGSLSKKWIPLTEAPFKISEQCCNIMKKNPAKKYGKQKGLHPIIGTMAEESQLRKRLWVRSGCNMFDKKDAMSTPIAFWTEKDIWDYIKLHNLKYASVYDEGAQRTGCVFCMFGYWTKNERDNDRFEMLKRIEPKKYEYCMKSKEDGGLGLNNVISYINDSLTKGNTKIIENIKNKINKIYKQKTE